GGNSRSHPRWNLAEGAGLVHLRSGRSWPPAGHVRNLRLPVAGGTEPRTPLGHGARRWRFPRVWPRRNGAGSGACESQALDWPEPWGSLRTLVLPHADPRLRQVGGVLGHLPGDVVLPGRCSLGQGGLARVPAAGGGPHRLVELGAPLLSTPARLRPDDGGPGAVPHPR